MVSDSTSIITTVAGIGFPRFYGDNLAATSSSLYNPISVFAYDNGSFYIGDSANNRIRYVSLVAPTSMPTASPTITPAPTLSPTIWIQSTEGKEVTSVIWAIVSFLGSLIFAWLLNAYIGFWILRNYGYKCKFDYESYDLKQDRMLILLSLVDHSLHYKLRKFNESSEANFLPLPLLADGYKNGLPIDIANWIIDRYLEQAEVKGDDRIVLITQVLVVLHNRNLLNKAGRFCCCIPCYEELGYVMGMVYYYTLQRYLDAFAEKMKPSSSIIIHAALSVDTEANSVRTPMEHPIEIENT
jgi:hypothetical protein